jgi:hypothetical protein
MSMVAVAQNKNPAKSEFRDSGMVSNSRLDQPMSCFDFVAARANIVRVVVGGCAWFDLFVAQEHIGSERVNLKTWSTKEVSPDRTRFGFGF